MTEGRRRLAETEVLAVGLAAAGYAHGAYRETCGLL